MYAVRLFASFHHQVGERRVTLIISSEGCSIGRSFGTGYRRILPCVVADANGGAGCCMYIIAKIELTPREGWIGNMPRGQRGVFPSQLQYDANHICGAGTKSSTVGVHSGSDSSYSQMRNTNSQSHLSFSHILCYTSLYPPTHRHYLPTSPTWHRIGPGRSGGPPKGHS